MSWSIDTDDFHGNCPNSEYAETYMDYHYYRPSGKNSGSRKYPLLRTINEAITVAQEELRKEEENLIPKHDDGDQAPTSSGNTCAGVVGCVMVLMNLVLMMK